MKKLLAFSLAAFLLFSCALADVDLSALSYDQLLDLQKAVTEEIMNRPEWKAVTVPAGQWKVGEDIPAGSYSISVEEKSLVNVWKKAPQDFSDNGMLFNEIIQPESPYGKMVLETGWIVTNSKPIIFSPPISLGF